VKKHCSLQKTQQSNLLNTPGEPRTRTWASVPTRSPSDNAANTTTAQPGRAGAQIAVLIQRHCRDIRCFSGRQNNCPEPAPCADEAAASARSSLQSGEGRAVCPGQPAPGHPGRERSAADSPGRAAGLGCRVGCTSQLPTPPAPAGACPGPPALRNATAAAKRSLKNPHLWRRGRRRMGEAPTARCTHLTPRVNRNSVFPGRTRTVYYSSYCWFIEGV